MVNRSIADVHAWARQRGILSHPWVQTNLARAWARNQVLELLAWRQAWNIERDRLTMAEASTVKVYGSELYVEVYRLLLEVLGVAGSFKRGSPGAVLKGRMERMYRSTLVLTFGGGTNEVQRDIIAMAGLGIPRPPY
jgi:alkylation response protein AidB-like acyl-CoA dehydrogenase